MTLASVYDLLLYLPNGPAIGSMVNGRTNLTASSTHVVRSFIASRTDSLSSSNVFSPIPRFSALQISAQDSPRSTKSCSLDIVSWLCVTLEYLIVKGKGAHSDYGEENGHGAKDGVYWCGARGLLRDAQAIDGRIQCGDNPTPILLSLGVVGHG